MSGKKAWFLRLARSYVRRRLRRTFDSVRIAGLFGLREQLARGPVILAPNHVAWWDPFVCVALDEALGGGGHCLMDAANLEKLPFFAWLGALPLDREHGKRGLRDLERAAAELSVPGDFLIMFPQGRQRPAHLPLEFQRGVELLARRTGLPVVPLGLRYDFVESAKAEVHLSCGAALSWTPGSTFLRDLERAVTGELRRIDEEISAKPFLPGYSSRFCDLVAPSPARLPLAGAALARLARRKSV